MYFRQVVSNEQFQCDGHSFPNILNTLLVVIHSKYRSCLGRPESESGIEYSIPKLRIGTDSEIVENRYPDSCNFHFF